MVQGQILQAGRTIVRFYQELAPLLVQTHALAYPEELARLMVVRLAQL